MIIGIDPDSKAHGVAIYQDNKLVELCNLQLMDILNRFLLPEINCHFVVENVMANKPVFKDKFQKTRNAQGRVGQNVGQCKHAQVELIRALDYYDQLINPTKGNWGTSRSPAETKTKTLLFKKATGWTGRSNADQRSAAFFGFLAINKFNQ
jgi:hypothetical protein